MPGSAPTFRCLTSQEQRLVHHFTRPEVSGAIDKLPIAAKRARVPLDKAKKMLGRIHVQEEIAQRLGRVQGERALLQAQDVEWARQAEERRQELKKEHANRAILETLSLPADKFGPLKLQAAKLALVLAGEIRDGRVERVTPAVTQGAMYRRMFGGENPWAGAKAEPLFPQGTGTKEQRTETEDPAQSAEPGAEQGQALEHGLPETAAAPPAAAIDPEEFRRSKTTSAPPATPVRVRIGYTARRR